MKYGRIVGAMTVTEETERTLLRLPMWIEMTPAQVQFVLDSVVDIANTLPEGL